MIYRFVILSGEQDDFLREIEMEGVNTLFQLHAAIQENCGFDPEELASFYLCNEHWEKETEITLIPFDDDTQADLMQSPIDRLITHKKQKLIYLFDLFAQRGFFIETIDIREKTDEDTESLPRWTRQLGEAPLQFDEFYDETIINPEEGYDEDFDFEEPDNDFYDGDDFEEKY